MTLTATLNRQGRPRPRATRSALDRACQATDDAALGNREKDERWQHRQRGEAKTFAVSAEYCDWKGRHAKWQRKMDLVVEHEQRQNEVVPTSHERQDGDRRQCGHR